MGMNQRLLRPSASGFTPRSITGLALWLDASDASTLFQDAAATTPATATSDPVGSWLDKSGNGRHATQSTAGYRGVVGTQGSRRAITLDGTDDHLLLGNLSAAFPTAGEVVTAYALNAVDSAYTVYQTSDNANSDVFGGITFAGTFRTTRLQGLTFTGPSSIGTHLWGVSSQSSGYNLWVEGSQALTTTSDHTGGANHAIGMRSATPGANQALNGKLLEVCAFNRVLSAAERGRLNRYLAAKWGITLAPFVSNADAQDWVNRVYANGGTVSSSTAAAVSTFCDAIDAAGIRDRFYRLNLFCGGTSGTTAGLAACLVPLYRGQSLGGTQYGNIIDTNNNFAVGDYAETGAGGGLLGNGTSKYLNTGLTVSDIGTAASGHMAVYHGQSSGLNSNRYYMGANDASTANRFYLGTDSFSTANVIGSYGNVQNATQTLAANGHGAAGHRILSRETGSALTHYHNGSVVGTNAVTITPAVSTAAFAVFAANRNGTVDRWHNSWIAAYSIGLGLNSTQAANYRTIMQNFQAAMGRNV